MKKTYISLLRGINVGGKRKILMNELKALCASLGFEQPTTYIQSGNLVFETNDARSETALSASLCAAIAAQYGFDVPILTLCSSDFARIIAKNDFAADTPIEKLHATLFTPKITVPSTTFVAEKNDKYCINADCAYLVCEKYHETPFSNAFFEKKFGVSATTRNWKTMLQLGSMLENR